VLQTGGVREAQKTSHTHGHKHRYIYIYIYIYSLSLSLSPLSPPSLSPLSPLSVPLHGGPNLRASLLFIFVPSLRLAIFGRRDEVGEQRGRSRG